MKKIILCAVLILTQLAAASEIGVKVDKINTNESDQATTISIQKGNSSKNSKKYTISEGQQEIIGDNDVVRKSSEISWKAECAGWKKEFRNDNKDNKIITLSCGKMECAKTGVETTCTSLAKYKLKTLIEE